MGKNTNLKNIYFFFMPLIGLKRINIFGAARDQKPMIESGIYIDVVCPQKKGLFAVCSSLVNPGNFLAQLFAVGEVAGCIFFYKSDCFH